MADNQKLYRAAAWVLKSISQKKGLAKQLCLQSDFDGKKPLLALVTQTLRFHPVLSALIEAAAIRQVERKLDEHLLLVLVHDAMVGQGVRCGGPMKATMAKHKSRLQSELIKMKIRAGVKKVVDLLPKERRDDRQQPRYARVNHLLVKDTAEMVGLIQAQGFTLVDAKAQADLLGLAPKTFAVDPHLTDLVVFAPGTDLHDSPLYISAQLILQDKASCIPAYALSPPREAHCIDACAAPGNKTSHLAAILGNTGAVIAFDPDQRRMALLQRLTGKAGATCIATRNMSFLEADVTEACFAKVTHALCDPSCSGSGMSDEYNELLQQGAAAAGGAQQYKKPIKRKRKRGGQDVDKGFNDMGKNKSKTGKGNRKADRDEPAPLEDGDSGKGGGGKVWSKDSDGNDEKREVTEEERAVQLSEFQTSVVLKAMTFPAIERVSYSTCSIYEQENEQVVARILDARPDFEVIKALPAWPRRGIKPEVYPFADKVLRADRKLDGTTGFFVALFSRKGGAAAAAAAQAAATVAGTGCGKAKKKKKKKKKTRNRKRNKNNSGAAATAAAAAAATADEEEDEEDAAEGSGEDSN